MGSLQSLNVCQTWFTWPRRQISWIKWMIKDFVQLSFLIRSISQILSFYYIIIYIVVQLYVVILKVYLFILKTESLCAEKRIKLADCDQGFVKYYRTHGLDSSIVCIVIEVFEDLQTVNIFWDISCLPFKLVQWFNRRSWCVVVTNRHTLSVLVHLPVVCWCWLNVI